MSNTFGVNFNSFWKMCLPISSDLVYFPTRARFLKSIDPLYLDSLKNVFMVLTRIFVKEKRAAYLWKTDEVAFQRYAAQSSLTNSGVQNIERIMNRSRVAWVHSLLKRKKPALQTKL